MILKKININLQNDQVSEIIMLLAKSGIHEKLYKMLHLFQNILAFVTQG